MTVGHIHVGDEVGVGLGAEMRTKTVFNATIVKISRRQHVSNIHA